MRTLPLTCLAALLLALSGCAADVGAGQRAKIYDGPTDPMWKVVEDINRNNAKLPTLWASHDYELTVVDEKKQSHFINGDGAILYRSPAAERGAGMMVVGNKPGVGQVFEIGTTAEKFWLTILPEMDTMWHGDVRNLGKPCVRSIPIRPDMVAEVLGIGTIGSNFMEQPAPVMRFNNDARAYMFVWVVPADHPARLAAQREVWYDLETKRPTTVLLFDADGRVQLRAYLSKHQQVEVEDVPPADRPWVATSYRLFFPETGTKMSFTLNDVRLQRNGVPTRKGLAFPGVEEPGVSKVIQLDKDCVD